MARMYVPNNMTFVVRHPSTVGFLSLVMNAERTLFKLRHASSVSTRLIGCDNTNVSDPKSQRPMGYPCTL
jgi:hypothetical protein